MRYVEPKYTFALLLLRQQVSCREQETWSQPDLIEIPQGHPAVCHLGKLINPSEESGDNNTHSQNDAMKIKYDFIYTS